jgi:serine/threonine protein kinase
MWGRTWNKFGSWLKREDEHTEEAGKENADLDEKQFSPQDQRPPAVGRRPERTVVPGLPRNITFRRQNSERREHLYPVEPDPEERRASSVDRRASQTRMRRFSTPPVPRPSVSAPDMRSPQRPTFDWSIESSEQGGVALNRVVTDEVAGELIGDGKDILDDFPPVPPVGALEHDLRSDADFERRIQEELDARWILNLSMHFRDLSDREKFFITYAEERNKWRRVTISIDYRNAEPDSLESEMKNELHYQRDKCARIYESIRDSLPSIKFYPTVTNLKLETRDGRLHVHVTEDVNEIIPYPEVSKVQHVLDDANVPRYKESEVEFEAHMSGFVYKVRCPTGRCYIKKEIPGPEAVEEFLYEVDALYNLHDSPNVIHFEGLIISDDEALVKGLLISYAREGALVDLLYDFKHSDFLPWSRREQWAKQIVSGLSDIHEAGFTQGDFTLSNIVIDGDDNAKIIDINRRGCPVGWEPPELLPNIRAGQRISMRIGPKTDLFQLGMVLWALGEEQDEPERQARPLIFSYPEELPNWYQDIVSSCLSENPRDRLSAKDLLKKFPADPQAVGLQHVPPSMSLAPNRSEKEFIDPDAAVSREDIAHQRAEQERHMRSRLSRRSNLDSEATFADAITNSEYVFESSGSYVVGRRERSPHSEVAERQSHAPTEEPGSQKTELPVLGDDMDTPPLLPPPMMRVVPPEQKLNMATAGAEEFDPPQQLEVVNAVKSQEPELQIQDNEGIPELSLQEESPTAGVNGLNNLQPLGKSSAIEPEGPNPEVQDPHKNVNSVKQEPTSNPQETQGIEPRRAAEPQTLDSEAEQPHQKPGKVELLDPFSNPQEIKGSLSVIEIPEPNTQPQEDLKTSQASQGEEPG